MNDKQIDRLLHRIEKEHQCELKMLNQFRIDYFETAYLEELLKKWKVAHQKLQIAHKKLLLFAACSPLWLVMGVYAKYAEIPYLSYAGLLFPISIFVFMNALLLLYKKHGSLKQHDHLGDILELELSRRRDRMYI